MGEKRNVHQTRGAVGPSKGNESSEDIEIIPQRSSNSKVSFVERKGFKGQEKFSLFFRHYYDYNGHDITDSNIFYATCRTCKEAGKCKMNSFKANNFVNNAKRHYQVPNWNKHVVATL